MPKRSITLRPQNGPASITGINCGSSTPKLSGTINIEAFPNLTSFVCTSNDITSFAGANNLTQLKTVILNENKLTSFPNLSGCINLETLEAKVNSFTGTLTDLSACTKLKRFDIEQNPNLTGPLPNFANYPDLNWLIFHTCNFTGTLPSISTNINIVRFYCYANLNLTGTLPDFSANAAMTHIIVSRCNFTGSPPALHPNIRAFYCDINKISGSIPDLSGLPLLRVYVCMFNQITGFTGGVPALLGTFAAQNNSLTQSAVDSILAAFVAANKTTEERILNIGGPNNSVPSSIGMTRVQTSGTNFSQSGTLVTVTLTNHGYVTGDWVTVTDIAETAFQGTFAITKVNDNVFTYTTLSTGTIAAGSGTVTLRKTSTGNTSGFRSYQNLALVSRTGGPWTITINFPV